MLHGWEVRSYTILPNLSLTVALTMGFNKWETWPLVTDEPGCVWEIITGRSPQTSGKLPIMSEECVGIYLLELNKLRKTERSQCVPIGWTSVETLGSLTTDHAQNSLPGHRWALVYTLFLAIIWIINFESENKKTNMKSWWPLISTCPWEEAGWCHVLPYKGTHIVSARQSPAAGGGWCKVRSKLMKL